MNITVQERTHAQQLTDKDKHLHSQLSSGSLVGYLVAQLQ